MQRHVRFVVLAVAAFAASASAQICDRFAYATFEIDNPAPNIGFVAADLDNDGDVDAMMYGGGVLQPHENRGLGGLDARPVLSQSTSRRPEFANINGDALPDLVFTRNTSEVYIGLNNGDFTFTFSTLPAISPVTHVAVGDTNNDGFDEVIAMSPGVEEIRLWTNNAGTFASPLFLSSGPEPQWATMKDVDNDGFEDFVFMELYGEQLTRARTFRGRAGSGLQSGVTSLLGEIECREATLADLNRDGLPELLVSGRMSNFRTVHNLGGGSFGMGTDVDTGVFWGYQPLAGDFNNDGWADIVVGSESAGLFLLMNNGAGALTDGLSFGDINNFLAWPADFTGDGSPDLLVSRRTGTNQSALFINLCAAIPAPTCTGDIADDFGFLISDGQVSFGDFLALLGLVGQCP